MQNNIQEPEKESAEPEATEGAEEEMNFNLPLKKKKKKKTVDFSMIDNLDSEKQNEGRQHVL